MQAFDAFDACKACNALMLMIPNIKSTAEYWIAGKESRQSVLHRCEGESLEVYPAYLNQLLLNGVRVADGLSSVQEARAILADQPQPYTCSVLCQACSPGSPCAQPDSVHCLSAFFSVISSSSSLHSTGGFGRAACQDEAATAEQQSQPMLGAGSGKVTLLSRSGKNNPASGVHSPKASCIRRKEGENRRSCLGVDTAKSVGTRQVS